MVADSTKAESEARAIGDGAEQEPLVIDPIVKRQNGGF